MAESHASEDWERGYAILCRTIEQVVPIDPVPRPDGSTPPSRRELLQSVATARHLQVSPADWAKVIGLERAYLVRCDYEEYRRETGAT